MGRKGRGKGSVLRGQRPRKGRKGGVLTPLRLVVLAAVVLVGVAALAYVLVRPPPPASARSEKPVDWKVSLETDGHTALPDKTAEQIIGTVKKHLGKGSRDEMRKAARLVQQAEAYARVHIVKLGQESVAVHVRPRHPRLCVDADRLRLVGADGAVYGTPESLEECPGPSVKGVFEPNRRFNMREDFTVELTVDEQMAVREALDLLDATEDQGLVLASLEHRRYRGYFVTLKDSPTEIAVGRAPFPQKLDKLQGILSKLTAKGEQALRIELDYQGKAFIKLKKM